MCLDGTKDFPFPLCHFVCNHLVDEQYLEAEKKSLYERSVISASINFVLWIDPFVLRLDVLSIENKRRKYFLSSREFRIRQKEVSWREYVNRRFEAFVKYSGNRFEI